MPKKYIDLEGLAHVWGKIKSLMGTELLAKADIDFGNVTDDDFRDKANEAGVGGVPIVTASTTDGVVYAGSTPGVSQLKNGLQVIILPNTDSASLSPKFNLNGLGAKYIRQSTTNNTATELNPDKKNWMAANRPVLLMYDAIAEVWKTGLTRANATDLHGIIAVENGGTGADTAEEARENLGINEFFIKRNGNRDAIAGYEMTGSTSTINRDSPDSSETGADITVYAGNAGETWVKLVRLTSDNVTIKLNTGWAWNAGVAPTLKSTGLVVFAWCGNGGVATYAGPV